MRSHTQKTKLNPFRLCRQKSSPPFLREFNISGPFGMQNVKTTLKTQIFILPSPPFKKKHTIPSQTPPPKSPIPLKCVFSKKEFTRPRSHSCSSVPRIWSVAIRTNTNYVALGIKALFDQKLVFFVQVENRVTRKKRVGDTCKKMKNTCRTVPMHIGLYIFLFGYHVPSILTLRCCFWRFEYLFLVCSFDV